MTRNYVVSMDATQTAQALTFLFCASALHCLALLMSLLMHYRRYVHGSWLGGASSPCLWHPASGSAGERAELGLRCEQEDYLSKLRLGCG